MRAQSVSAAVRRRAWQAAIAACSAYGPSAPPSSSARSSAASPRRMRRWSQRAGPDRGAGSARPSDRRAPATATPGSPSAPRGRGPRARRAASSARIAPEPQRVLAQRRAHPVVARGRRVPLVEDEVDDLEHRRQARVAARRPRGTSNGTRASASVRLARTMRWATVGSGTRNARAISSVVRPPSSRSVSATRASVDSTGWQAMKISRSRSSPMSSSGSSSLDVGPRRPLTGPRPRGASSSCLRSSTVLRRSRSIARCLPVAMSHAPGLSGTPDAGHCSSAATRASWARSSARPTSRTMRARPAMSRADSIRQTASMARARRGRHGPASVRPDLGTVP